MFTKSQPSELYFLKTGNYLLPFRGYFKSKKKLKNELHKILDESITALISEWEKTHQKKWEKNSLDIISNDDLCHSVQIMKLSKRAPKFFTSYFVIT